MGRKRKIDPLIVPDPCYQRVGVPDDFMELVVASYSADRLSVDRPVRKPFAYANTLRVATSHATRGTEEAALTWRLVPRGEYAGPTFTYSLSMTGGRRFTYEGMLAHYRGTHYVMTDPLVVFLDTEAKPPLVLRAKTRMGRPPKARHNSFNLW